MPEDNSESNITGLKLKLYFEDSDDKREMNQYFEEYAKVATFAAKKINQIRNSFRDLWLFSDGKRVRDENNKPLRPMGKCNSCNEQKELIKESITTNEKFCLSCYSAEYSKQMIRKKLVPRSTHRKNKKTGIVEPPRKVHPSLNVKNAGTLALTHYQLSVKDAIDTLKALKNQQSEKRKRLRRDKERLKKFEEILNYDDKRHQLEMKPRQRIPRFVHRDDVDKNLRGWTLASIRSKIKVMTRNTLRAEQSLLKPAPIKFKGSKISLCNNILFDIENNRVKIPLWKSKWYTFSGTNVKNKKSVEFFKEKLSKIKNKKYGHLIRRLTVKKVNPSIEDYEFYLQYPVEETSEIRKVSNIMGVDIGLNKLIAVSVLNPDDKKPFFVRIVPDEAFRMRIKRRKQSYFFRGKHNKRRKLKKLRNIESRINYFYHTKTKDVINWAIENNAAIVLEDLKDLRKKSRMRERKETKYKLSQFVYKTIRLMIEYKAKKYGIPVILVEPEGTSYTCSKCGSTDTKRPKQAIFSCNNPACELNRNNKIRTINADYNASCNIAKKGLNTQEWKSLQSIVHA